MTDPRDFDRRMEMERQMEMERRMGAPTIWAWIAGAVFIVVILALMFAGGENTPTAREDANPPATTGMAPRTAPPLSPSPRRSSPQQPARANNGAHTAGDFSLTAAPRLPKLGCWRFSARAFLERRHLRQTEYDQLVRYPTAARCQRTADEIRIRSDHRVAEAMAPGRHGRERDPAVARSVVALVFRKGVIGRKLAAQHQDHSFVERGGNTAARRRQRRS